jgi:hypothetical protein
MPTLRDVTTRPPTDRQGLPIGGSYWGLGAVVRGVSPGPGGTMRFRNPLRSKVTRLSGFRGADQGNLDFAKTDLRTLVVQDIQTEAGKEVAFLVE